ncbi:MAG: Crp/Fnr family transcriptional regulator, partial [Gammaproteobacteria bacterium]
MDGGRIQKRTRLTTQDLEVVRLLRGQPSAVLESIAQKGVCRTYDKDERVIDAGRPPTAVFLLLSGQVRVQLLGQGQRKITYQLLNAGEMFGELACIDNGPRTADVTAETDAVVAQIPAGEFRRLLHEHAEFAQVILQRVVMLSRWLSEKVFEYHAYNLTGRICAELLRLS